MSKKLFIIGSLILLIVIIATGIYAESTVCCEKTKSGAWCQNAKPEKCSDAINSFTGAEYRATPTSCDATSYCKSGCCYDSQEGVCMESTSQLVCQMNNGTWADSAKCEIPQCSLGCCVLDNQAAFVPLVRCKKLSGFYGVKVDFRRDVKSENACIALAQAQDRGACVYEEEFTRTCKFTTRQDCESVMKTKKASNLTSANATGFFKDYLCSAEELGTNCAPSEKTVCIPGKDEVYFLDSCGNPANIYDSGKLNDKAYWKKVIGKAASCGFGNSNANANSASCGNCDYFGGSFCRQYDKKKDSVRPSYGNYICRDLNCKKTKDGKNYRHGESWCIYDDGTGGGLDPVGSRYWKHVCVAGEEIVEPCADFRQEVCIQDKIVTDKGAFQQAGCAANKWQDCVSQTSQDDCENTDRRDCRWVVIAGGEKKKASGKCAPNYPPGLKFWTDEAAGICAAGNAVCEVEYEKRGLIGGEMKPIKNADCEKGSWIQEQEKFCSSLGDCRGSEGVYKYLKSEGFGVSGTKMFMPLAKILGLVSDENLVTTKNEEKSVNRELIGGMKK